MIDTAIGGMKTRFTEGGKNPGMIILASSKRSEKSFLEEHMKKKVVSEHDNVIIVDEAVWDVKPKGTYSDKTFKIAVGNRFLVSQIIPDDEDEDEYRKQGYRIIDAPVDLKPEFVDDIDRALCDFAGISSSNLSTYISGARWEACKCDEVLNPFTKDIIEVGNAPDDKQQYSDYFDLSRVPSELKSKPLFVHLDMSISGDKTGIGGVFIYGKKPSENQNQAAKDLYFQTAFGVSVKAPKGYQVSFEKNRNFIRWLREQGFNIKMVSSDTFQSYDLQQQLKSENFNTDILSVDRVDTDRICRPYQYFRSTIYEQRIRVFKKCDLLTNEVISLERNGNTGRIDHPENGCFTGNTKVSLVDGRELSFFDLVREWKDGKANFVYSLNLESGIIEPKKIDKAWCTRKNATLVAVTLDNGEIIKCTPNHRFMDRDGNYIEAKDLMPGQSLMPLYRKYPNKGLSGYRMYYEPIENKWHYEHRQFAKEIYDEKYLVHHKNVNPKDNSPTNLVWMSKSAHALLHASMQTGAQSYEANKKRSESIKQWHEQNKNTDAYKERNRKLSNATKKQIEDNPEIQKLRYQKRKVYEEIQIKKKEAKLKQQQMINQIEDWFEVDYKLLTDREKNSYRSKWQHRVYDYSKAKTALAKHNESVKGISRTDEVKEKVSKSIKAYFQNHLVTDETRRKMSAESSSRSWYNNGIVEKFLPKNGKIPDGFVLGRINHKVVSIEFLDEKADVYDIEVADNHNFALSSGVFVHNSKDLSDSICGATFEASKYAEQYAFDYGDDLKASLDANMMDYDEDKKQITLDFEEELKKAFKATPTTQQNAKDLDFGFGPSIPMADDSSVLISQGLMIW